QLLLVLVQGRVGENFNLDAILGAFFDLLLEILGRLSFWRINSGDVRKLDDDRLLSVSDARESQAENGTQRDDGFHGLSPVWMICLMALIKIRRRWVAKHPLPVLSSGPRQKRRRLARGAPRS